MRMGIAALLLARLAMAQTGGVLTGTVTDLGGDAVPGVAVQAVNLATKTAYHATSSDAGRYTFAQLPAGGYEVSLDAPGYNKFVQQGVAVTAAQTVRLDIHLMDF